MIESIKKQLEANKNVKAVNISTVIRVTTLISDEKARLEVYKIEQEIMKQNPDTLFDFSIKLRP
jgi:hypothetical protein